MKRRQNYHCDSNKLKHHHQRQRQQQRCCRRRSMLSFVCIVQFLTTTIVACCWYQYTFHNDNQKYMFMMKVYGFSLTMIVPSTTIRYRKMYYRRSMLQTSFLMQSTSKMKTIITPSRSHSCFCFFQSRKIISTNHRNHQHHLSVSTSPDGGRSENLRKRRRSSSSSRSRIEEVRMSNDQIIPVIQGPDNNPSVLDADVNSYRINTTTTTREGYSTRNGLSDDDNRHEKQTIQFQDDGNDSNYNTTHSQILKNTVQQQQRNELNYTFLTQVFPFWTDQITSRIFCRDLTNLAQSNPGMAQDAVDIMQELYRNDPYSPWVVKPDISLYETVLDGWIEVGELEKAQAVLDRIEVLANTADETIGAEINTTKRTIVQSPTETVYLIMAQGWASDWKDDFGGRSAENAERILRRMQLRNITASVKIWNVVIEGWCKRVPIYPRVAIQRAEQLLTEMESLANTTSTNKNLLTDNVHSSAGRRDQSSKAASEIVRPTILTYTSFIGGLARSQETDLAGRAEKTLQRMIAYGIQPDMVTYTAVLNCWSKATSRREREVSATRARYILEQMERLYTKKQQYLMKPSLVTYEAAIAAIGNSLDVQAPVMAEEIIKKMYKFHESGAISNIKPTTLTYNAVIYALSKASKGNGRLKYAKRAEQLLYEMTERSKNGDLDVEPDVRTWAGVLRAWSRSGLPDSAENAQRVLDMFEDIYNKGITTIRPNYVCYTTVMGAWGYSKRADALDRMESILLKMENGYGQTQDTDLRPNTVSYVTAIDAFIRRNEPDLAQRAQATVDRMMQLYSQGLGHVRPTRTVFNVLIHAWSKSKEKNAARNAEKIFTWMEDQYRAGDDLVRPDEVSLCAVLNAWANQAENGGAARAIQIWEHTKLVSLEERGVKATIAVPNIIIKAIARSNDPNAHRKAEDILFQLEEEYTSGKSLLRPDVTTYSSVINACAYCVGNAEQRADALKTALRTFYKLCQLEDERPNNITYGTILKAIRNLMPMGTDRERLVRDLFDQCCTDGLVDSFVLSQVRSASPQLYRDFVEAPCGLGSGTDYTTDNHSIDCLIQSIPPEWSANVVEP